MNRAPKKIQAEVSFDVYFQVKTLLIEQGLTWTQYILDLVLKDLDKRKNGKN